MTNSILIDADLLLLKLQEDLPSFVQTYIEKKRKHIQATRKYALKDPSRTRGYANDYYNRNKDNPEFRQKMRERALNYYYNKKSKNQLNNNIHSIPSN